MDRNSRVACCLIMLFVAALGAASLRVGAQDLGSDGVGRFASAGCVSCHGPEGRGTASGPPIAGTELSAEQFLAGVRRARGAMPAYGAEILPDPSVTAVYEYLSARPAPSRPAGRSDVGGRLYEQAGCYSCHSNQAQGGTQGPRIGPAPARWGRFVWYMRHPTGQMPPYSAAVLTDQELADIYAFLETRPIARPVDSIPLLQP